MATLHPRAPSSSAALWLTLAALVAPAAAQAPDAAPNLGVLIGGILGIVVAGGCAIFALRECAKRSRSQADEERLRTRNARREDLGLPPLRRSGKSSETSTADDAETRAATEGQVPPVPPVAQIVADVKKKDEPDERV